MHCANYNDFGRCIECSPGNYLTAEYTCATCDSMNVGETNCEKCLANGYCTECKVKYYRAEFWREVE